MSAHYPNLEEKNYADFFTTQRRRNSSGRTILDVVLEVGVEVGENYEEA